MQMKNPNHPGDIIRDCLSIGRDGRAARKSDWPFAAVWSFTPRGAEATLVDSSW